MKAIVLAAALSALAAPVLAAPMPAAAVDEAPAAVRVSFGDLDLGRGGDAARVLDRITDAALEACGAPRESLPDYRWAMSRSACVRSGVSRAVAALDAPAVTRLYSGRSAQVTASPGEGR